MKRLATAWALALVLYAPVAHAQVAGGAYGIVAQQVPTQTAEAFTLNISTTGTDPTVSPIITTSAQAAQYTFLTLAAALAALPRFINHVVTISLASGSYTTDSAWYGDASRVIVGKTGLVLITAATGLSAVSGTTSYTLSAGTAEGVTFSADPSFVADTYARYFLKATGGACSGQIKPIRSHTTTAWVTAGRWSSTCNNGSTVQIVEPQVTLTLSESIDFNGLLTGLRATSSPTEFLYGAIVFQGIKFSAASNLFFNTRGGLIGFDQCIFSRAGLTVSDQAMIKYGSFIIDGTSNQTTGLIVTSAGFFRTASTSSSLLIARCTTAGMSISCADFSCGANLSGAAFDATVIGVKVSGPAATLSLSQYIRGVVGASYGFTVAQQARVIYLYSDIANYPTATTADIRLDGVDTDWVSDIDGGDADHCVQGARWSTICTSGAT